MDAETLSTIILLGSFLLMVFLRFPIAYSVGISTVLCLISMGQKLSVLPMQMVRGVWSFSLMAVPFFITMGVLMGSGGISEKLIALANSLVGWMRGGLAQVNIVASYFFGGISGSASADTASLGSILIPMMVDEGYDVDFSTAVTITSSCEGLLVPPSHNMVIYATTAGGISVQTAYGFSHFYQNGYEIWGKEGKITTTRAFTARPDFAAPVILETRAGRTEQTFQDDHFANLLTHIANRLAVGEFADEYEQNLLQARLIADCALKMELT